MPAALIGIGNTGAPVAMATDETLCDLLLGPSPRPTPRVILFSDIACGPCRQVQGLLDAAQVSKDEVVLHDWPLLGSSSTFGARVAVAAGLQGKQLEMHRLLLGSRLRPSEAGLRQAAGAIGIDGTRLVADVTQPEVDRQLQRTASAAARLRLAGTPAMIVGNTVIEGLPSRRLLTRLLRDATTSNVPVCSG